MTKAQKEQLKKRCRDRIDAHSIPDKVINSINRDLAKYEELNLRARDFAVRYAISPHRTYQQWANIYQTTYATIQRYMMNPRVRALIDDIRSDLMKYMLHMQQDLMRDAMSQYRRIFNVRETDDNMEAKRKAAKEVLSWAGIGDGSDPDEKPARVNISIGGKEGMKNVTPESVDVEDIKADLVNLEKKQKLRELAERYGGKE